MKMPVERKGRQIVTKVAITVIVLGAIAYGAWYVWKQYEKVDTTSMFRGEAVCLPLRSSPEAPDPATCDKGMKSKDGLYFVVQDVPQASLKIGEDIAIKGNLDPVTDETGGNYAVSGLIIGKLVVAKR